MTSNHDIAAASLYKNRRPAGLIFLFGAATITLLGVPMLAGKGVTLPAPIVDDITACLRDPLKFFEHSKPVPPQSVVVSQTANSVAPIDDLKLMDRASASLLEQISKSPRDPALHNRLALMLAGLGDYNASIVHFEKAIDFSRSQIAALKQQEKNACAKQDYEKASKIVLNIAQLNVELSAAHSSLARVYDQIGKHDRVVSQLDQLNIDIAFGGDLSKKDPPASVVADESSHQMGSNALRSLARAQALIQAHRFLEAMQEYKILVGIEPESAMAHEHLGETALVVNDPYTAAQQLEMALRLDPEKASTHKSLGVAYQTTGDLQRAQIEFQKALSLDPREPDAPFNLGSILAERGLYDQARNAFQIAVRNNPRSAIAHNHFGTLLNFQGDYRSAMIEFQQALALSPDLASAHYGLGLALYNSKDFSSSIREFKRALALNPNLVDAHNKIDSAYRKSGLATIGSVRVN